MVRTWPSVDGRPSATAGAGIVLCVDNTDKAPEGTLVALGAADGRQRWTRQPAKGTRFGGPLLGGGRVYVVQQPDSRSDEDPAKVRSTLVVLDAATGRRLHSVALPPIPPDTTAGPTDPLATLMPWQAAGGVVAVQWAGMFAGSTADLLVVAQ